MGELTDWLSQQHHGLKTYKAFRQTLIDRVSSDAQHRALYRLLAGRGRRSDLSASARSRRHGGKGIDRAGAATDSDFE
jgi:hypothetical protein